MSLMKKAGRHLSTHKQTKRNLPRHRSAVRLTRGCFAAILLFVTTTMFAAFY
jgi:hypothetical protein